jgi:hypothetical protein
MSRNSSIFFRDFAEIFIHEVWLSSNFCGKSELIANYTTERRAFLGYNSQKVKTFRELFCGKFQHTAESQNLTFWRPITTFKLILDKNSTVADQCYPRFGRKNRKTWDQWEQFDFPQILRGKSNFVHRYLREFAKQYKTFSWRSSGA